MGCGCKGKVVQTVGATPTTTRVTVYQVMDSSGSVIGEYPSLTMARQNQPTGSRVKVTSQQVPV